MSQTWHACRLSKTYLKDANEAVERAMKESDYWMIVEHTSGLTVGIGDLEVSGKIEERSFVNFTSSSEIPKGTAQFRWSVSGEANTRITARL